MALTSKSFMNPSDAITVIPVISFTLTPAAQSRSLIVTPL